MINLNFGDSLEGMATLSNSSVDCILTDPPYKYLKNQKLEVDFDETIFFNECKRVLKDDGFIVLFGRGTSFYRWNTMLAGLGFVFKEEIVWDKCNCSSPLMAISRIHETISLHTKKNGKINRVKIPYLEMKKYNVDNIIRDINRMRSIFTQVKSMTAVLDFIKNNIVPYDNIRCQSIAISSSIKNQDRCASVVSGIANGLNEKIIIKQVGDHCTAIHPTQKPVRLLERLLGLVSKEGDLIVDPFSGSGASGEACRNTNRNFIGWEIDEEYYNLAKERLDRLIQTKEAIISSDLFINGTV